PGSGALGSGLAGCVRGAPADVEQFGHLDVSYVGDGKLAVGTELHLAGSAMPVTVVGEPYVSGGRLSLDPDLIELGSQQLPGALFGDTLLGRASSELPTDLPLDAEIVGVEATAGGMRFELHASGRSTAEAFATRPRVFDRDGRADCEFGPS
nr:hypothetical protein [Micromonospora sp. DSM 115978]